PADRHRRDSSVRGPAAWRSRPDRRPAGRRSARSKARQSHKASSDRVYDWDSTRRIARRWGDPWRPKSKAPTRSFAACCRRSAVWAPQPVRLLTPAVLARRRLVTLTPASAFWRDGLPWHPPSRQAPRRRRCFAPRAALADRRGGSKPRWGGHALPPTAAQYKTSFLKFKPLGFPLACGLLASRAVGLHSSAFDGPCY